jgi:hypothetical protein
VDSELRPGSGASRPANVKVAGGDELVDMLLQVHTASGMAAADPAPVTPGGPVTPGEPISPRTPRLDEKTGNADKADHDHAKDELARDIVYARLVNGVSCTSCAHSSGPADL